MSGESQRELRGPGPLLLPDGRLADVGWARQPLLDCNLEAARFYHRFRFWQRFRIKRWDYYAITTQTHFFSFTIADIGYLGQVFAYVIDFESGQYHEEALNLPLGQGVTLPRNSTSGVSSYSGSKVAMRFDVDAATEARRLLVRWPGFDGGKGLAAEVRLALPREQESVVIVIPIKGRRFYYNRKVNCIPVDGWVAYAGKRYALGERSLAEPVEALDQEAGLNAPLDTSLQSVGERPRLASLSSHDTSGGERALANLDWGRGVWEYRSFWIWASASGFLPDGRTVGLNLGTGFGDTSAATENALILDGKIHKLGQVDFQYDPAHFRHPWRMTSPDGRVDLTFTPFFERVAQMDLKLLSSEVHQMFGRYSGRVQTDGDEMITLDGLIGFAEEHHAKW